MEAISATPSMGKSKPYMAIVWGGLLAGTLDITAAFVNSWLQSGRSPIWILQSIASGLLGANAYNGGLKSAALGLFLHFLIAYTATTLYFLASLKLRFLVDQAIVCGLLYGVVVYLFMNLIVLRLAFPNRATPAISVIVTQTVILMFCIGLPIALVVRKYLK